MKNDLKILKEQGYLPLHFTVNNSVSIEKEKDVYKAFKSELSDSNINSHITEPNSKEKIGGSIETHSTSVDIENEIFKISEKYNLKYMAVI